MTRARNAVLRAVAVFAGAAALTLLTADVVSAHIATKRGSAAQGSHAKVAFQVPNESATAGTVKLEVTLPADHPIASVRTRLMPGWKTEISKAAVSPPLEVDGVRVTHAVRAITWTAQPGTEIGPDQFVDFEVSMGALPLDVDQLVMPAVQTYDDGTVVRWDEVQTPGAGESEHPAPTLALTAGAVHSHGGGPDTPVIAMGGAGSGGGSDAGSGAGVGTDNPAGWISGAGLIVGALGLGVGIGAAARTRRRA